jgi:hypothetical protein
LGASGLVIRKWQGENFVTSLSDIPFVDGIPRIEPDYADPIYLAKHGAFIAALGKRYDGTPGMEFLDIGSYGIWDE